MNIYYKVLLAAVFFTLALMGEGCKKDESAARPIPAHPPGIDSVSECSRQHGWNLETIRAAAIGNWRLIRKYSWGTPTIEDVALQIQDNGTLKVIKDGSLLGESPYTIDSISTSFGLSSNRSWYAIGNLYICGDYMLLSNSSIDGPDLYYWRE